MPDTDRLDAELTAIRERWSKVAYVGMKPEVVPEAGHQPEWLPDVPRLVAAAEAALKVHAPVPVYQIALHGHAPDPGASFTLHCGHPASALEDDRHAESGEGDWICLDNLFRTACGGCRDNEGELADFEDCATRAAITCELLGEESR